MHPVPAQAPAGVLSSRDRPPAAFAWLTGGADPEAVRHLGRGFRPAEAGRAEVRYREPETSGAEMIQVRRADARADLVLLPLAHIS
jgi:hypothetical protein